MQNELGKIHEREDFHQPYPLITKELPVWNWTIKGNENSDLFPAKKFFYDNIQMIYLIVSLFNNF